MVGITAQGNPQAVVFKEIIEDGKPHPVTGVGAVDAQTSTRGDAHTINVTRLKNGKVVQTGDLGRITGWQDVNGDLYRH